MPKHIWWHAWLEFDLNLTGLSDNVIFLISKKNWKNSGNISFENIGLSNTKSQTSKKSFHEYAFPSDKPRKITWK